MLEVCVCVCVFWVNQFILWGHYAISIKVVLRLREFPEDFVFAVFCHRSFVLQFFTSETKRCNAVRSVRQMPSGHKTVKRRLEKLIRNKFI